MKPQTSDLARKTPPLQGLEAKGGTKQHSSCHALRVSDDAPRQQVLEPFQALDRVKPGWTRRSVIGALGVGICAPSLALSKARFPSRVASLDYALAETLMAIGHPPMAVANARDWATWVVEPALPAGTIDLGADLDVNLEVLSALDPDLVLTTDYVAGQEPRLSPIAEVLRLTIYAEGNIPLQRAAFVARHLGERLGAEAEATRFLSLSEADFDACRARAAALAAQPVLLVSFMDARHVRVYGGSGLYQNVLDRIGLTNAWGGPTNFWGFSTVGIEALATVGEARLVTFDPIPPGTLATLSKSPLWTRLPFVAAGGVTRLAPVLMFGALPSARRFAHLLLDALEKT